MPPIATAILALLVGLSSAGCRTRATKVQSTNTEQDTEEPASEEPASVMPVALWSPGQRQATASYYYLVAEMVALGEQDSAKALPIFEAAYGLDPNPYVGAKVVGAKAAIGRKQDALAEANKLVLLYPSDPKVNYLYGQLLHEAKRFDESRAYLEKAIQLEPGRENPYLLLIDMLNERKAFTEAIGVAERLTKNMPGSVTGWTILCRLHLATSNFKKALPAARKAYDLGGTSPQTILLYAVTLQLNGKPKEALPLYEMLYRISPTDEELTQRMVELYSELGNLDDALELLEELEAVSEDAKPSIQLQKAYLLWELQRFEEAAVILTKLAQDFPESERLRYLSGMGQERLGNFKQAIVNYQTVPRSTQFFRPAQVRIAVCMKELGQVDDAIKVLQALVDTEQADWEAFVVLGGILSEATRYDEAIATVEKGYTVYPDKHRLLFMKGVYQEKKGDIEACIATMRQVIAAEPANSSALNYLGYLYAERNENLDEAEQLVRRALEIKPNDGFYLDSLGWIYYQKGDLVKSEEHLQQALKASPDEGVILEHLGDVRAKLGKQNEAKEFYQRALKTKLEKRDRDRVQKKLDALPG
jgi:tetratricopeptide (TPR) repeat protein